MYATRSMEGAMQELLFGPVAVWFTVPALVGTVFFGLRTLSMLIGGAETGMDGGVDVDVDFDVDVDAGADLDGADVDVDSDSSDAFKILSLQTISAFLMGFGWGGIGAHLGGEWPLVVAVGFALVCGVGMVWLLAKLLRFVYGLQSSGNVPMYHALETEGTVYNTVPAKRTGLGRVRVVIGDREQYYRAITDGEEIATSETVRVVEINDDNSVTVTKA